MSKKSTVACWVCRNTAKQYNKGISDPMLHRKLMGVWKPPSLQRIFVNDALIISITFNYSGLSELSKDWQCWCSAVLLVVSINIRDEWMQLLSDGLRYSQLQSVLDDHQQKHDAWMQTSLDDLGKDCTTLQNIQPKCHSRSRSTANGKYNWSLQDCNWQIFLTLSWQWFLLWWFSDELLGPVLSWVPLPSSLPLSVWCDEPILTFTAIITIPWNVLSPSKVAML